MGTPKLFCGVTAGNLDSMLSNYTAARHKRKEDVYSEDGTPGKRPNHAAVVYSQMAARHFPGSRSCSAAWRPACAGWRTTITGRTSSSLRSWRMPRPTCWCTAWARWRCARSPRGCGGQSRLQRHPRHGPVPGSKATATADFKDCIILPSWEELQADKKHLLRLTKVVEAQQTPYCGKRMVQMHGNRAVLPGTAGLPGGWSRSRRAVRTALHAGWRIRPTRRKVPGFATIKDSIIVSRGCAGGCTFCGLGFTRASSCPAAAWIRCSRRSASLTESDTFRGTVSDLGGPTANLYGAQNGHVDACKSCHRPSCLWPSICPHFGIDEQPGLDLLRGAREQPGVKHVFVQSGIRMDVALRTPEYMKELVQNHVSGHMKVAPEHMHPGGAAAHAQAGRRFSGVHEEVLELSEDAGKEQYLVPYFISSFPGCTEKEMGAVEQFLKKENWNLQQVQDFIPLPMTGSAAMYVTGLDINTEQPIPVVRNAGDRERQKAHAPPKSGPPSQEQVGKFMDMEEAGKTEESGSSQRRGHRYWMPIWVVLLVVAGIAGLEWRPDLDRNIKIWLSVAAGLLGLVLVLLWFVFFSRFRWLIRGLVVAVLALLFFGGRQLVRVDGTTDGRGLPRVVWRWTEHPTSALSSPTNLPPHVATEVEIPPQAKDVPQFLGPNRDGLIAGVPLGRDWVTTPPRQLWRQPVGDGWSAFAVVGGRAYTQEQRGRRRVRHLLRTADRAVVVVLHESGALLAVASRGWAPCHPDRR
jgi:radical SAM superfamily enzyme YgiQ (UPF0313 family)